MGSDWGWELRLPADRPTDAVLRDVVALAADHGMSLRNPMGTITVFDEDGEPAFLPDQARAITALADGRRSTALWSGEVDTFVSCRRGRDRTGDGIVLAWYLDSAWTYRPGRYRVSPDQFRGFYGRRTDLWRHAAQSLRAVHGRITDEWSLDSIWELADITDTSMPAGQWPAWLGWSTYIGPDLTATLPAPPLPDIGAYVTATENGGRIIDLLEDPAAVDERRYRQLHKLWTSATTGANSSRHRPCAGSCCRRAARSSDLYDTGLDRAVHGVDRAGHHEDEAGLLP